MRFLFDAPKMAFFDCGGTRLLLSEAEEGTFERAGSILYFSVEGIQDMMRALKGKGVEMLSEAHLVAEMPDHDLWMSFFKDLDGNTLALMEEVTVARRTEDSG
jgi:methylmalonyl-CoA/ethylmalonyl-CoA epimerase